MTKVEPTGVFGLETPVENAGADAGTTRGIVGSLLHAATALAISASAA
jgi:hypothetical protein